MKSVSLVCLIVGALNCLVQEVYGEYVTLTHDGPCVKGGRIVFRADIFSYGDRRPQGEHYAYKWKDDGLSPHEFQTEATTNTTSYYVADYPASQFPVGIYTMEVIVQKRFFLIWEDITSRRINFEITALMNGNMSVVQHNKTLPSMYVASGAATKFKVDLRKGDDYYIKKNSSDTSAFWFVDCKYYGMTQDLSFDYKFPKAGLNHTIEALVIASHEPPTTTTVAPTTTPTPITTTTPKPVNPSGNGTANNSTNSVSGTTSAPSAVGTTIAPISTTVVIATNTTNNATDSKAAVKEAGPQLGNLTFPFVCLNNSVIPPDPKKTYGYFHRHISVKEPIGNITVEGTNWIQPWQTLALKVSCPGSGPFKRCLRVIQGRYTPKGNETCDNPTDLPNCNFDINHYFLESGIATVLVILSNDVSKQIFPITITVYKAIKKPQLSVIIVPVSFSLVAAVLVIFGVAYYIQSRSRYTVEVADFDFGQSNPDLEYKTFTARLRDSFNNSVRPSGYRINTTRRSYYGSMNDERISNANSKPIDQPLLRY